MDSVDLRVQGSGGERRSSDQDTYDGEEAFQEDLQFERLAAGERPGSVPEAFQFSQERARLLEAALARLGPRPGSRICSLLKGSPTPEQLDEIEAWLHSQLPHWGGPVHPEEPGAEAFNEGLAAGADGLHLALEVVALLRQGGHEAALAGPLLDQVESYFQAARVHLLEAEPAPEDESEAEAESDAEADSEAE